MASADDTLLPDCSGTKDWLSYPRSFISFVHSGWHSSVGQLKLRLDYKESAQASFRACVELDPCAAHAHYQLATLQYEGGDMNGSETHFALAAHADPSHTFARLRLNALRQLRAQGHFWGHLDAAVRTHPALNGSQHWAQLQERGSSVHHMEVSAVLERWPALQLAMNAPPVIVEDLTGIRERERKAFKKACKVTPSRLARRLPGALASVRKLENRSEWLVLWAVNRLQHFGKIANGTIGLHSSIWFEGWQEVASTTPVVAALEDKSIDEVLAVVVGSSLGSMCFFALALGATRCIGYDVLCSGLVEPASKILEEHDLTGEVEFRCGDARRMKELPEASLIWMNDNALPPQIRKDLRGLVARDLREQGVAITLAPLDELAPPVEQGALKVAGTVRVMASWAYNAHASILKRAMEGGLGIKQGKRRRKPEL